MRREVFCNSCMEYSEVEWGNFPDLSCPKYGEYRDRLVLIDRGMGEVCSRLLKLGLRTIYSCSGHSTSTDTFAYVTLMKYHSDLDVISIREKIEEILSEIRVDFSIYGSDVFVKAYVDVDSEVEWVSDEPTIVIRFDSNVGIYRIGTEKQRYLMLMSKVVEAQFLIYKELLERLGV